MWRSLKIYYFYFSSEIWLLKNQKLSLFLNQRIKFHCEITSGFISDLNFMFKSPIFKHILQDYKSCCLNPLKILKFCSKTLGKHCRDMILWATEFGFSVSDLRIKTNVLKSLKYFLSWIQDTLIFFYLEFRRWYALIS